MSKRKRPKPDVVRLPTGEEYRLMIAIVNDKYPDGCPKELRVLRPHDVVRLPEDRSDVAEFETIYIRSALLP